MAFLKTLPLQVDFATMELLSVLMVFELREVVVITLSELSLHSCLHLTSKMLEAQAWAQSTFPNDLFLQKQLTLIQFVDQLWVVTTTATGTRKATFQVMQFKV